MRRLGLALLVGIVLIGARAEAQWVGAASGWVRADGSSGGGSGTVTSVGSGTIGPLFAASWATATTTPALSLNLAAQSANCVVAGPATAPAAVPTCRSLVAADLGTALSVTFAAVGATTFTGALTGNASTATALAADPVACGAGDFVTDVSAAGVLTCATPAGGVTNSAGANVLTKSDGTNLVATALNEASAGAITTDAGVALSLTATPPAATTGASQAGKAASLTASAAVASTDTDGAAAGGAVTITAGNAARRTSGNASGGDINLAPGAAIGTGIAGSVVVGTGRIMSSASGYGFLLGSNTGWGVYNNLALAGFLYNGNAGAIQVATSGLIGISSTAAFSGAADVLFRRKAAANPAWGLASATPVAYLHSLAADSRGGTDTDVAGAAATIQPGLGTGTATPAALTFSTANPTTTGTTQQTALPSIVLKNSNLAMADATAVAVFTVDLPTADTGCGVTIMGNYSVTDGTDTASHQGTWVFAFTNDDATVTGTGASGDEVVNGTGCDAACDTASVTVAGTVASAKLAFDNTLAAAGTFRGNVLYNNCGSLTLN